MALQHGGSGDIGNHSAMPDEAVYSYDTTAGTALGKMSSLASIAFAVGSQKLLLNI